MKIDFGFSFRLEAFVLLLLGLLADKRIALSTCYSGDSVLSVPTPCTTSCASLAITLCAFSTCKLVSYVSACSTSDINYYTNRIACTSGLCVLANTCTTDNCNQPLSSLDATTLTNIETVNNSSGVYQCYVGTDVSTTVATCSAPCNTVSISTCAACATTSHIYGCADVLASGTYSACGFAGVCKQETPCLTEKCNAPVSVSVSV